MDDDSLRATAKKGLKRRWQRRWATICKDCGTAILFLDQTQPPVPGKKWSPWVACELYPERDGELLPWNGAISYSPRDHVKHICVSHRRKLAWVIRNKQEYDL